MLARNCHLELIQLGQLFRWQIQMPCLDFQTLTYFLGLAGGIDPGNLAEQDGGICADVLGSRGSGTRCPRVRARGHDLVEQRLEQMVITPVDQGHTYRHMAQGKCQGEPAKAAADDDMLPGVELFSQSVPSPLQG